MTVTSSSTEARLALKALLEAEFAAEQFPVRNDKLHPAVGGDSKTTLGIYPLRQRPQNNNLLVLHNEVMVQFYGRWKKEIDPETRVDPAWIEEKAERFMRMMKNNADPNTPANWYFTVDSLDYPPDPTGNITRFEARVTCYGNNPALIETTG